ncbi:MULTISPECIES: fimbria/pilus periplasmic chaperone [unclassified Leptolyngbya]|uniref:fimbrial biogenesis chaperone n=1 Tax=unclassified Leptolyngbya TaxID=2650499 RepID=UPI001684B0FE|nr:MULTISPECIES: fimbria/pilus periplasmic chaperone [unclassified Leptolyngbya]MBD1909194.1 molecular chaperone [Leptolyngbya sp. FACHB-8]MBD2152953.1 molecular chaperone [Leptolyngbya sp. FACHB-16]
MKRSLHLVLTSIFFLVLTRANPALAFQFRPMSQVFAPMGANATHTYEVVNDESERIAIEVSVVERQMNLDGEETYQPAEDNFLIYPTQMILEPGAVQVVRVSWLGEPNPAQELPFRLVAEQLPINLIDPNQSPPPQAEGQIQVLLRYLGSLFVRPDGAQATLNIESVAPLTNAQGQSSIAVTFANTGSASARLQDLSLTLISQGQSVTLAPDQLEGITDTTVLAGHSRRYTLAWPTTLPQGSLTATFNYRQQD